jgi:cytochrome c-type biogenesis protein CcmH
MRSPAVALLLFFMAAWPGQAHAADAPSGPPSAIADEHFADPALEARARALQKELRCLVCQGESLDESQAPLAADLRRLVREHIAAGESDADIKRFLVARYGDFILMQPPVRSDTVLLWFGPALFLLFGGGLVAFIVLRARRSAAKTGH